MKRVLILPKKKSHLLSVFEMIGNFHMMSLDNITSVYYQNITKSNN